MSTTLSDRLRGLLEPLSTTAGFELEEIEVTPAGKRRLLRVVVDSEDGVRLDAVAELSRRISQTLDDSDVMGGAPYVLEVTSPGTDRPLTEPRHFARNTGRLIKARLADGGELTARITEVDEDGVELEVPGVKGRKATTRRLGFGEIARARVEVEFNRSGAADEQYVDEQYVGVEQEDEEQYDDAEPASAEIEERTEEA